MVQGLGLCTLTAEGPGSTPDIELKSYKLCRVTKREKKSHNKFTIKRLRWKKILHLNGNQRKAGAVIHMSDKTDFKIKTIIGHKEERYILIKESIQEEYIITANTHTPIIGAPQ